LSPRRLFVVSIPEHVSVAENGAGRKSGERTFQQTLERKHSVERKRVKSAAQSPLTSNISLI